MDRDVFALHSAVEETHWWFAARRSILRALADAATAGTAVVPPTVVDVGCGVGATLTAFHPDWQCVGVDPSADAVELGRLRHPEFRLEVATAAAAAPVIGAADVVLLNDVIEHVPDDRALLKEIVAPMKRDAVLLVTVPADMKLWSPHDVALGHYRRYDTLMLADAIRDLPVETAAVSHFNARLYPLIRAARLAARMTGRATGGVGTDLRPTPRPLNYALQATFEGEKQRLVDILSGHAAPYRRGVSLLGVYRRT